MSNYKFKKLLRNKIEKAARLYLESQKKQKTLNLKISKFTPQEYILSKNLSTSEVQNLFKIRNSMIDVKVNFKSTNENIWCRLCSICSETQEHLLFCFRIRDKLKGIVKFENLNMNMAYQSLKNQEILAKNYTIILNARNDIISRDLGNQ